MVLAKKTSVLFGLILFLGGFLWVAQPVKADESLFNRQTLLQEAAAPAYGNKPATDIKVIILKLVNTILTFLGIIVIALLIASGFQYMTSQGNKDVIDKAVGRIKSLVIGLIIILAAWGITYYLLGTLVCVTTYTGVDCTVQTLW